MTFIFIHKVYDGWVGKAK